MPRGIGVALLVGFLRFTVLRTLPNAMPWAGALVEGGIAGFVVALTAENAYLRGWAARDGRCSHPERPEASDPEEPSPPR